MNNRTALAASILIPAAAALLAALPAHAQTKSCEQLRDEIAARINLPKDSYRLDIVAKDEPGAGRPMGSCEGGTRKVLFVTGEAVTATAPKPATDPKPEVDRPQPTPQPASEPVVEAKPTPHADPAPQPAPDVSDHPALTKYRWAVDQDTVKQYLAWIAEARAKHPYEDAEDRMIFLMSCESRGNATIVGGGKYTGLFQYSTAMWGESWNEYRAMGITDAHAQIFATAKAWSMGQQKRWGSDCYPRTAKVVSR